MSNKPKSIPLKKKLEGRTVSTIPLAFSHLVIVDATEYFETMVFSNIDDDEWYDFQTRYPDAIAAVKGHERVIELIKAGSSPDEF